MKKSDSKGVITLEACVSVLSFLLLLLMLAGLFTMFMAQNETSHAVLQTSQSLSIDAYAAKQIGDGGASSVSDVVVSISKFIGKLFGKPDDNTNFAINNKWYDGKNEDIAKTVKTRFTAYISGGDDKKANEQLKHLNIVNGLDGCDFTKSYVSDDTLYIVLEYKLKYNFQLPGLNDIPVKQTTCSKLWK